jgi:hypothetical protein
MGQTLLRERPKADVSSALTLVAGGHDTVSSAPDALRVGLASTPGL